MKEARITVSGRILSIPESMTVRVALNAFAQDLQTNGLGDDSHGKLMTKEYLSKIKSVLKLIQGKELKYPWFLRADKWDQSGLFF